MTTSVVIHPCFQECQDYTLDQFWKDTFFACACNKFPRGVRYDSAKRTLHVRTPGAGGRNKIEIIDLPETSEEIFDIMIQVFREKLGLYSSLDLQIKRDELDEVRSQKRVNMDCEWKGLKPRSLKDTMIVNYVAKLRDEYDLSDKEVKKLYSQIQLGFQLKKIESDDVEYSDRAIQNIEGLEYDPKTRVWSLARSPKISSKSEKTVVTQKFYQSIDSFLRSQHSRRLRL